MLCPILAESDAFATRRSTPLSPVVWYMAAQCARIETMAQCSIRASGRLSSLSTLSRESKTTRSSLGGAAAIVARVRPRAEDAEKAIPLLDVVLRQTGAHGANNNQIF